MDGGRRRSAGRRWTLYTYRLFSPTDDDRVQSGSHLQPLDCVAQQNKRRSRTGAAHIDFLYTQCRRRLITRPTTWSVAYTTPVSLSLSIYRPTAFIARTVWQSICGQRYRLQSFQKRGTFLAKQQGQSPAHGTAVRVLICSVEFRKGPGMCFTGISSWKLRANHSEWHVTIVICMLLDMKVYGTKSSDTVYHDTLVTTVAVFSLLH